MVSHIADIIINKYFSCCNDVITINISASITVPEISKCFLLAYFTLHGIVNNINIILNIGCEDGIQQMKNVVHAISKIYFMFC